MFGWLTAGLAFFRNSKVMIFIGAALAIVVILAAIAYGFYRAGYNAAEADILLRDSVDVKNLIKGVNDAIDDLGHPGDADVLCLLDERGEIRDGGDLPCP